jgi:TIR domain
MSDIFICYATEDRAQAQRLYHDLSAEGFDVWLDIEKLSPGVAWKDEIQKAIREANYVLVLFSKHLAAKEALFRQRSKKPLRSAKIFRIPRSS